MEVLVLLLAGAAVTGAAGWLAARPHPRPPAVRACLVQAPMTPALPIGEFAPPALVEGLRRAGIGTVHDLLAAERVDGVDDATLADLRRRARLLGIPNVGREEARLLLAAGVQTPEDLLATPPTVLAARLNAANHEGHWVPGEISPGEVRQWAESVREGARQRPQGTRGACRNLQ